MNRLSLHAGLRIPNANGAILTGREQRSTIRREGQAGDILEMTSQFSFLTSCLNINEADDSPRGALTTHGQSPAIGRKRQAGESASAVGKRKPLPPLG